MTVAGGISAERDLGRRVYSESVAKKVAQGLKGRLYREFLIKRGQTAISVDRLSIAPLAEVAALAQEASASRDGSFHGWALIAGEDACGSGRRVRASPVEGNPYHAEIVLPDSAATDRGEQVRHAQQLADATSGWRDAPPRADGEGTDAVR